MKIFPYKTRTTAHNQGSLLFTEYLSAQPSHLQPICCCFYLLSTFVKCAFDLLAVLQLS